MDSLMALRAEVNGAQGTKTSVNDYVIKAAALALQEVPACNSQWTDDYVRQFTASDISVAVNTDRGLSAWRTAADEPAPPPLAPLPRAPLTAPLTRLSLLRPCLLGSHPNHLQCGHQEDHRDLIGREKPSRSSCPATP